MLEQDGVNVDKDGAFPPRPLVPGRLHQDPEGVAVEDEGVDQEHPALLPHHHPHRRRRLLEGGERAVAEVAREGGGAAEEGAASDGPGGWIEGRMHRIGWAERTEEMKKKVPRFSPLSLSLSLANPLPSLGAEIANGRVLFKNWVLLLLLLLLVI